MARLCVCIPTWNGARYLPRILNCLFAQRDVDLRILVGDDASLDNTVEVARGFSDPRISVYSFPEHAGLAGNWNRMLGMADGDYVALVGQDDEVTPVWAARLVALLESYPKADLAFGRRLFAFDAHESQYLSTFFTRTYPKILAGFYSRIGDLIPPKVMLEEAHRHLFQINLIGEPTFVVMRRNASAIKKGFDARLAQMIDWEFFTRFFVEQPILHCPEVLGTYHIHSRSASVRHARDSNRHQEQEYLLRILIQRFAGALARKQIAKLQLHKISIRIKTHLGLHSLKICKALLG
jgi:glycosyltransferase involved in cell wall biosynthesis